MGVAVHVVAVLEGAAPGEELTAQVKNTQAGDLVGDVNILVSVDVYTHWTLEVGPLVQIFASIAKYLHPIILPVTYENPAIPGNSYAVGYPELSRTAAGGTKGGDVFPVGAKPVDAGVAVPIGNVDITRRRNRYIRGVVEWGLERRAVPSAQSHH